MAGVQRARILSAMVEVSCERGAHSVSVAHVVGRSGVSRRTFYEQFSDREDCFLAAFEQALAYASERVIPAYTQEQGWRERIRAALIALLAFLDDEPLLGRILVCESIAGGPRVLERRSETIAQLIGEIEQGREESKGASHAPPLTGEGVLGGVLAVIGARLSEARREPLIGLTNQLTSTIVLPYLGAGAARRELDRPVSAPASAKRDGALLSDPFRDTGMRLSYRTVRVLLAIAEQPGASNRQVGESAGITDQGQISKLLARLQRIGLACNTGLGQGKGAPNAWTLTEKGRQVTDSIRAHTLDEGTAS